MREEDPFPSPAGSEADIPSVQTRLPSKFWPQFVPCFAAASAGLVMGCSLGWPGPVLAIMKETGDSFQMTKTDESWVASILLLGAVFGGPVAGFLVDSIGRRATMMCNAINFAVSLSIVVLAQNKWMLFAGRFVNGMSCGIATISSPTYVSEVSSSYYRGFLGSLFQLMITIGILFINVIGPIGNWRWITVSAIVIDFLWGISLLFIPESPVYQLKNNDEDSARSTLVRIRGSPYVSDEIDKINAAQQEASRNRASPKDLLKPYNLKPLAISIVIVLGQQASGINAVVSFSETIFSLSHSDIDPFVQTAVMDLAMVIATVVAAAVCDKLGRRILLIISGTLMVIALSALGIYFYLKNHDPTITKTIGWLPLLSLSMHVIAFSFGYGPIPWLIMSELFAIEVRGLASSIAAGANWSLGFLVTLLFQPLESAVGPDITFFGFGGAMLIFLIMAAITVPETKGKSLEEIQRMFRGNVDANDEDSLNDDSISQRNLID